MDAMVDKHPAQNAGIAGDDPLSLQTREALIGKAEGNSYRKPAFGKAEILDHLERKILLVILVSAIPSCT